MRMREVGRLADRHKVGSAVVCQEGEEEDGFELQGWNSGILSALPRPTYARLPYGSRRSAETDTELFSVVGGPLSS